MILNGGATECFSQDERQGRMPPLTAFVLEAWLVNEAGKRHKGAYKLARRK